MGHGAYGFKDLAGGAHGARHVNDAARRVGFGLGVLHGRQVELAHPVLRAMKLKPVAVAAEGVGEDDVGPRLDELAVQLAHPVRVFQVPHFRGIARNQAHLEIIGAGGAVGKEPGAGGKGFSEGRAGHGASGGNDINLSLY